VRLRLKLYPAMLLLLFACCGCFSVEYQTEINRRGGGTRTVEIVMDPMMAGLYNKSSVSEKLFNIPGQGLQAKNGVVLAGSSKAELDDGSLKLSWRYRTGRAELFSDGADSLKLNIARAGLWVYYEYREIIPASQPEKSQPSSGQNIYRIRHKLAMPGQVISHNADSILSGSLIWNRPLGQVTDVGLVMEARSRELNPIYILLALFLLLAGVSLLYRHKSRLMNNKNIA